MNTRSVSVGVGVVLGIFIAVWLTTLGDDDTSMPTKPADPQQAAKGTPNTANNNGTTPNNKAADPTQPSAKARPSTTNVPSSGSPSGATAADAGLAGDEASDASAGTEDASSAQTGEGGESGDEATLMAKKKLEQTLQGIAFPSVLMCLNERVARGDSFSGALAFAVRVKANPDDPNNADIELKSVDGKSLGQEDFACIWSGFEDQVLPIKDNGVGDLLKNQDGVDSRFEISIDIKGAKKDKPQE